MVKDSNRTVFCKLQSQTSSSSDVDESDICEIAQAELTLGQRTNPDSRLYLLECSTRTS